MTKVSVVLYYWILIAATLLLARTAGLADNNSAIVKILVVVTILYVGVVLISRSKGKEIEAKTERNGSKSRGAASGMKRKKKR